jgi:hypothetical protein
MLTTGTIFAALVPILLLAPLAYGAIVWRTAAQRREASDRHREAGRRRFGVIEAEVEQVLSHAQGEELRRTLGGGKAAR